MGDAFSVPFILSWFDSFTRMSPSLRVAVFTRVHSFRSPPRLLKKKNENALHLSVTVLSTKVLIR